MKIAELYSIYKQHPNIQTDTRKLKEGELFFALKGPNFNGNKFINGALDMGAAYVIADEENNINNARIILVNDVLTTLQELAKHHRNQFPIPFIAITGSNGKTTTKELLHHVLSTQYKTYTTEGNLNNHIGVPLTILKIKDDAEMAVIEMGANHLKEIASYCEYAQPTHGLITNIGKAHLEGFGSEENVKIGKGELFDYLKKHDGIAFVNSDDKAVNALGGEMKNSIYFGSKKGNCKAVILENSPFLKVKIENGNDLEISTRLVGDYNLPNIVVAACVGNYFKIKDKNIKHSIEAYTPSNSRSQWMSIGTNDIILDAYNANPGSMKAAIENFAQAHTENKILVLGDMKEMGDESEKEHVFIVKLIDQYKWKHVLLVGKNFAMIKNNYLHFENAEEALDWLTNNPVNNAGILIKGSRSMQMEKVLPAFE